MSINILVLLFLKLSCVKAAAPVLALEGEELDSYIKKNSIVMLHVYGPNCPKCKEVASELVNASKTAKEQDKPYKFVKINGRNNPETNTRFKIRAFPALKLFVNEQPISYEGEFKAEDILQFMEKKSSLGSVKLTTLEEVQKVIDGNGLRVLFE